MKVTNIKGCARCGGDHGEVIASKLSIPFAPPEARPVVWTHWFPCPSNGEPVLLVVTDENAVDGSAILLHGRRS